MCNKTLESINKLKKMEVIKLSDTLTVSRIVHGHWRLLDWNLSPQELLTLTQNAIELGITTFDHADIYGNYSCEEAFGKALTLNKSLRNTLQLVTKCGIKLATDKFPERKVKFYDYSADYIIDSVNNSLKNFNTDYIDLLLLHRPAPFFNPEEVAIAFSTLQKEGKVLNFGVSNFNPHQYELLNSVLDVPLVTNQVELSPYNLEHFHNGNIDFFIEKHIKPMAWSPLAGGKLINPSDEKSNRIYNCLKTIAEELNIENLETVVYSWLLKHPATIIPIVGTQHLSRLALAVNSLSLDMSLEQWYRIYIASEGKDLP
jgi:predicted oxidoreductase